MRRPLMISVEPTMRPPLSAETATAMPERRPVRGAMRRASSARSWAISERRAWNLSGSKESGGASGARASPRRELWCFQSGRCMRPNSQPMPSAMTTAV